ncbi:MAG: hypothetical protein HZA00_10585, partial [Nitrospinae bacterium]|nr:hypothetical protein [Nitrospinota bacterium]
MRHIFLVIIALFLFLLFPFKNMSSNGLIGDITGQAFAEIQEIISEGTYNMGDGETPTVAGDRALL